MITSRAVSALFERFLGKHAMLEYARAHTSPPLRIERPPSPKGSVPLSLENFADEARRRWPAVKNAQDSAAVAERFATEYLRAGGHPGRLHFERQAPGPGIPEGGSTFTPTRGRSGVLRTNDGVVRLGSGSPMVLGHELGHAVDALNMPIAKPFETAEEVSATLRALHPGVAEADRAALLARMAAYVESPGSSGSAFEAATVAASKRLGLITENTERLEKLRQKFRFSSVRRSDKSSAMTVAHRNVSELKNPFVHPLWENMTLEEQNVVRARIDELGRDIGIHFGEENRNHYVRAMMDGVRNPTRRAFRYLGESPIGRALTKVILRVTP